VSCIVTYEALEGFYRSPDGSLLRYPFQCTAHPFDFQVLCFCKMVPLFLFGKARLPF
jgi:hypothetical protein